MRFVSNCNSDQTYTACFQDSTLIRLDYFNAWTTKLNATWNLHDRSLTWGRIINNAAVFRGIWCDFVLAQGQVEWKVGFIVTQSHNQVCSLLILLSCLFSLLSSFSTSLEKWRYNKYIFARKRFSQRHICTMQNSLRRSQNVLVEMSLPQVILMLQMLSPIKQQKDYCDYFFSLIQRNSWSFTGKSSYWKILREVRENE